MLRFIFGACLLFSLHASFGQRKLIKPQSDWRVNNSRYVENTIVVKFKKNLAVDMIQTLPQKELIKKALKGLSINSLEKLYPDALPLGDKSKMQKHWVDLSTTYVLKYRNTKHMSKAIEEALSSGLFEYAEPLFIEEPLLIPNDPNAALLSNQWHLARIKAYEAWDIETGDTNVVVGIVDTDFNIAHEDLIGNIKFNYADPVNGTDDDKDGYVDNFSGWDVANFDGDVKAKQTVIQKTVKGSKGQDSIINVTLNGHSHASLVTGVLSATTNNALGIAGTGFKCKYLPIKGMLDIDAQTGSVNYGYQGLIYAANHGCKVVNLSWGSTNSYSHAAQEAINYAVFNKDVLVIAAAGNQHVDQNYYPASYENVLSVAASSIRKLDTSDEVVDIKADFATYNYEVDISAPGASIYTTYKANNYTSTKGSSLAAPQVAGAAALVRSKFKNLSALQAGELIRVTSDVIDTISFNRTYAGKLGKGRLNMYKALSNPSSPSVRMYNNNLSDSVLHSSSSKDTLTLVVDLQNYLQPTKNLFVTLKSLSPNVVVTDSVCYLGVINTLDSVSNLADPFKLVVVPNGMANEVVTFRLSYSDSSYSDYQYFYIVVNPNYLTVDTNEIALTLSGIGRLGLHDVFSKMTTGVGLKYKGNTLLYEGGLMVSASGNRLSNCVRNEKGNAQDNNFLPLKEIRFVPALMSDVETYTEFKDTNILNVPITVTQKSWAWKDSPANKYILLEYSLKNHSSAVIDTMRAGLFTDWDLANSNANRGNWDNTTSQGYTYTTDNALFGSIAILSAATPICYTIDNASTAFGLYDGFTKAEKLKTLSQGIKNAAFTTLKGSDISQVVGAEIYNLQPMESRKVTFSIQAGDNLADLQNSVNDAKLKYAMINMVTQVENYESTEEITVFPNPAANSITISNLSDSENSVEILTTQGVLIKSYGLQNFESTINVGKLDPGLYFLKVNDQKRTYLAKFIKN